VSKLLARVSVLLPDKSSFSGLFTLITALLMEKFSEQVPDTIDFGVT